MRVALIIVLALVVSRPLGATMVQCPDGTPPPCGAPRPAPREPARAPDPGRIAVLPFRVTTADSLLGEGVAELLAAEFTGVSGPRAVHMGSVIQAWRRAGGGPRAPLAQAQAARAARERGAGLYVDGSIVGLGSRLTVTASVLSVGDGRARRAAPVSGPADSIDALLRRLTTNLLAVAGGEVREGERGQLTESADAMRAYLEGLAAWRRGRPEPAAAAFERAIRLDSAFARAAFMRYIVANWRVEATAQWARTAWALRDRLSGQDRILLQAYLGERYPELRPPAQNVADRTRAVTLLPESPEAAYILGDYLYHYGAAVDATDRLERARTLFERSLALDSQATVLQHLIEIAAYTGDTALIRRIRRSAGVTEMLWGIRWVAAARAGDGEWLQELRARTDTAQVGYAVVVGARSGVSGATVDALADDVAPAASLRQRDPIRVAQGYAALVQGRPAAQRRALSQLTGASSALVDGGLALAAVFGDGDPAVAAAAVDRLRVLAPPDSATRAQTSACWPTGSCAGATAHRTTTDSCAATDS